MAGSAEVLREQLIWIKKLQHLSAHRPILVQHDFKDTWHPLPCNHKPRSTDLIHTRSILPCELVLELDQNDWKIMSVEAAKLKHFLDKESIPHLMAWSGGKSIHFHILMKPSDRPFDDDLQQVINDGDLDVLRIARGVLSEYIVEGSKVDQGKAKIDPLKISWSRDAKGSMIREFGNLREDGGYKTLIDSIPEHKPKPGSLLLKFPSEPELWDIVAFHDLINTTLRRKVEAMRRETIQDPNYTGPALKIPCYGGLIKGRTEGTRDIGAFHLSRMNWIVGVPLEEARKDLIQYARSCKGTSLTEEREFVSKLEGIYRKGQEVRRISCQTIRDTFGNEICNKQNCPYWLDRNQKSQRDNEESAPLGSEMTEAIERLKNGTWKKWIQEALDALIAGERTGKWLLFYSGLSKNLRCHVHIYIMGKSQMGKTFLQSQIGENIFEVDFCNITEMSSKSFYYKIKGEKNPELLKNKIVELDEFADLSDDAQNFVKKVTSPGRDEVSLLSVEDQKSIDITIRGLPVIWTNSMKRLEDIGDQILNRFFPMNVDETLAQSQTVENFQKEKEFFGNLVDDADSKARKARTLVFYISQEKDFEVLNPFAYNIDQKDYSRRNIRSKFYALLSAITYANWRARKRYDVGGEKYLLSTLSDNMEALRIWKENEKYLRYSLPERNLKFLEIFSPGDWLSKEEMTVAYKQKHGHAISEDTCGSYAYELCEKDLLTSRYRKDERFKEWSDISSSEPSQTGSSSSSSFSMLDLENPERDLLARNVKKLFEAGLAKDAKPEEIEETVKALIDYEIPKKLGVEEEQTKIDAEPDNQEERVARIRAKVEEGCSFSELQDAFSGEEKMIKRLRKDGRIGENPDGRPYWGR